MRQPRWVAILLVLGIGVGFCLRPITLYEVVDRTRGFGIALPESSEVSGGEISVSPYCEDPRELQSRMKDEGAARGSTQGVSHLGDFAIWMAWPTQREPDRKVLKWHRGNVGFLLTARRLEGHEPNTEEWRQLCEGFARKADEDFLDGRAGSYEIQTHRTPWAVIRVRMLWDDWQRKQGKRPKGWWQDW